MLINPRQVMMFILMARYNQWANLRLMEDLASMDEHALRSPTGANYGSIIGILNHLLLGDTLWLHRFTGKGRPPESLDGILHDRLPDFTMARQALDEHIVDFATGLGTVDDACILSYTNTRGEKKSGRMGVLLAHFFNHQTHHRGQIHALAANQGARMRDIDLLYSPDASL